MSTIFFFGKNFPHSTTFLLQSRTGWGSSKFRFFRWVSDQFGWSATGRRGGVHTGQRTDSVLHSGRVDKRPQAGPLETHGPCCRPTIGQGSRLLAGCSPHVFFCFTIRFDISFFYTGKLIGWPLNFPPIVDFGE